MRHAFKAPALIGAILGTSIACGEIAMSVSRLASQKIALAKNSPLPGKRTTRRRWARDASISGNVTASLLIDGRLPKATILPAPVFSSAAAAQSGGGISLSLLNVGAVSGLFIASISRSPQQGGDSGSSIIGVALTPAVEIVVTGQSCTR